MAANRILQEFGAFTNFVQSGFKYNLQVFPDTITAASLLFTLLFQSPPLAALSGSILVMNFVHPVVAKFLSTFVGEATGVDAARCSGHFPGLSFERLMGMTSDKGFGALSETRWPSYYMTFMGFLIAYVGAMPLIYMKELEASPKRHAAVILGLVLLAVLTAICVVYRITSECDSMLSTAIGLLGGILIGLTFVSFLAYISDRRITNLLSMPLIRSKAADGKPIYVCERA